MQKVKHKTRSQPHVVIVGGGFGGLYAAQKLGGAPVRVTLIDRRNFHLFQPLLYQIATGGLSPGDIASPLRAVLAKHKNIVVLKAEVDDFDLENKSLVLKDGELNYDLLIIATGSRHHYFGNEQWEQRAPGLKTIENALEMRRRIFMAFEAAEREPDAQKREAALTFVIVGGGPTGVELAGALAELAHHTLADDFRNIDPANAKILLLEGSDRILPTYPAELSQKAHRQLERLGVSIQTDSLLTDLDGDELHIKRDGSQDIMHAKTVLWGAGVKASELGAKLARQTAADTDSSGRVYVEPDLTVPGQSDIFVIGDLANFSHQGGEPLPGVAPVAMQQGRYIANLIKKRLRGKSVDPFRYRDKGSLAVIGRNAAIADFGSLRLSGFPAWFVWIFVHIMYLVEFDNKIRVFFQWAWDYFTRKRGARLITEDDSLPVTLQPSNSLPARKRADLEQA